MSSSDHIFRIPPFSLNTSDITGLYQSSDQLLRLSPKLPIMYWLGLWDVKPDSSLKPVECLSEFVGLLVCVWAHIGVG